MEKYIGLGLIALFIVVAAAAVLHGKKRTRELKNLAMTMELSFLDEVIDEDDDLIKSLNQLSLFNQSRSQEAWNIMQGMVDNIAVTIMDHRYSFGSQQNRKVSEQTVIVFQSELLRLPSFTLRPCDLPHTVSTALLGYRDIDFAAHTTFSKQYHLHGTQEKLIRQSFSEDVVAYFEEHRDLSTDGHGDRLMFCRASSLVAAEEIQSFLEQGFEVFRLFRTNAGYAS